MARWICAYWVEEVNDDRMIEERRKGTLSDEEFEALANRAAEIVRQQVYEAVGKGVITKALWVIGAGVLALAGWLAGAGKIKLGG